MHNVFKKNEDTIIRIQYNGQKKKNKRTNNELRHITHSGWV